MCCVIFLACSKTFGYRLYPTCVQKWKPQEILGECRWLYNKLLEARRDTYNKIGKGLSLHSQHARLVRLKRERESLKAVHSQALQTVAARLDLAFKASFRRVKSGEKPGYPRFKGQGRYDSFTYPQSGFRVEKADRLWRGGRVFLSKIGHLKAAIHRPLEGAVMTATVRHSSSGTWYICFSCEVMPEPLPGAEEAVGVDVGLDSFATTSEGEKIANRRFFRKDEKALGRVQRRLSEATKGTKERERKRKAVAKVYERITNRRWNFEHQASRRLVDRYGFIVVEDLSIDLMNRNHCLAKSIRDAAWGEFMRQLVFKAEWAGRQVVKVNPAYTSQVCSHCGRRRHMHLPEREYRCGECGLTLDRHHNAAKYILSVGLHTQAKDQEAVALRATE